MSNITEEAVGNIRTVKSFSNEEQECQKFLIGNIIFVHTYILDLKSILILKVYYCLSRYCLRETRLYCILVLSL